MKKNNGFTLIETAVAVAITGVLITTAAGVYKYYLPKSQFSESVKMMHAEIPNVLSANAMNLCTVTGANQTIKGKYGSLVVSGTYNRVSGKTCPTGCALTYTFNGSDVSKELAGTKVVANVTAGGELSKTTATNVPGNLVPASFNAVSVATGDNCTALGEGSLTTTNGTLSGTDKATAATPPGTAVTPTTPEGNIAAPTSVTPPATTAPAAGQSETPAPVQQTTYHAKYDYPVFFNVPTWSENTTVTLKNGAVIENVRVMSASYSIFVHFYRKSGTTPSTIDIQIKNINGNVSNLTLNLTNDPVTTWTGYEGLDYYVYEIPQSATYPTLTSRYDASKAMLTPEAYVFFK